MDHKITGKTVMTNEVLCDNIIEQPVETDFTLPDYCPDIGKILKCRALPRITGKAFSSGTLSIEGVTRLEIIYLDGRDKHIRCCEHDVPFSVNTAISDCPDNSLISLSTMVEYINCRAVSQRKLDIHGAFSIRIRVYVHRKNEIVEAADGAGIRLRREQLNISTCIGRVQNSFTISEALELAAGKPPIATVIRSSAYIKQSECKAISNKLILKGDAVLKIVYTTEPDGNIESMEYALPFSQFIDLPGAEDNCITDCRTCVNSLEINLRTDPDGEYRRMNVDIRTQADAAAYCSNEISLINDAYSVEYELKTERKFINFKKYTGTLNCKGTAITNLEFENELSSVNDIWCEVTENSADIKDGSLRIHGNIKLCAIASCAENDKEYIERIVPFECTAPLSENVDNGHAEIAAYIQSCTYTLSSASSISVKAEVVCGASVYENIQRSCISKIDPDVNKIKAHADEPALVVYFADAGEKLWNIAREHNSSVEIIQQENDLCEDTLINKCMLLIPVR